MTVMLILPVVGIGLIIWLASRDPAPEPPPKTGPSLFIVRHRASDLLIVGYVRDGETWTFRANESRVSQLVLWLMAKPHIAGETFRVEDADDIICHLERMGIWQCKDCFGGVSSLRA